MKRTERIREEEGVEIVLERNEQRGREEKAQPSVAVHGCFENRA